MDKIIKFKIEKDVVNFTVVNSNFGMRVDIHEIAAYFPRILNENSEDAKEGTTIILKSGETLCVNADCEDIDFIFETSDGKKYAKFKQR